MIFEARLSINPAGTARLEFRWYAVLVQAREDNSYTAEHMTPADEQEMYRLCELLGTVDKTLPASSPLREGLKKGAIALQAAFIHGHRGWIESMYKGLHDPAIELTAEQRAHLASLGINPRT